MTPNRPSGSVQYDNTGRVAVVTGGAGGIGGAICEALARSGATVLCLDVQEPAEPVEGVVFHRCDTSNEDDCQAAVRWAIETHGGLDILVNNAAVQPAESYVPVHEMPAEVWNRLVSINFSGYTFMAKHALRHMKQQKSGVVVNIASAHGHRSARKAPAYGPIKAGNILQAMQWGLEYARDGVRVVSVSPGAIDTPLVRMAVAVQGGGADLANRHPLGRIGRPEEIASAVLWLSSAGASFVTATDLQVDGGLGAFAAFAPAYEMEE